MEHATPLISRQLDQIPVVRKYHDWAKEFAGSDFTSQNCVLHHKASRRHFCICLQHYTMTIATVQKLLKQICAFLKSVSQLVCTCTKHFLLVPSQGSLADGLRYFDSPLGPFSATPSSYRSVLIPIKTFCSDFHPHTLSTILTIT